MANRSRPWQIMTIVSLLVFVSLAQAERSEVGGRLRQHGTRLWLEQSENPRLLLSPASRRVEQQLRSLDEDDFVSLSGDLDHYVLKASEIHFVGLQRTLGSWVSDDGSRVEFLNFNTFTWQQVLTNGKFDTPYTVHYMLAPLDEPNSWSIFMLRQEQALAGRAHISKSEIRIEIWMRGRLMEAIHLRKRDSK